MKSADHLHMPKLVSSEYTVRLSEDEQKKYTDLKQELVLSLGDAEITAANAASLSGKLSQMANGAIYDDGGETTTASLTLWRTSSKPPTANRFWWLTGSSMT